MDDANLQSLKISPGNLSPKFHTDTTAYTTTVGSGVEKVNFTWSTRDSSASCEIKGGRGSKSFSVAVGKETEIIVICSSQDGSNNKNYVVKVTRMSATDAVLSSLKTTPVSIAPEFSPRLSDYYVSLSWDQISASIETGVPDSKMKVEINGVVGLKCSILVPGGKAVATIKVISPDRSKNFVYNVTFTKARPPRPFSISDPGDFVKYSCPICLNILHSPHFISNTDPKTAYCYKCLDAMAKGSNINPFTKNILLANWKKHDEDLEMRVLEVKVKCSFASKGSDETLTNSEMKANLAEAVKKPTSGTEQRASKSCEKCGKSVEEKEISWHKANWCAGNDSCKLSLKHQVTVRPWENRLKDLTIEGNQQAIDKELKDILSSYCQNIPDCKPDASKKSLNKQLRRVSVLLGTSIGKSPKKASLHFELAKVLEEIHVLSDVFGIEDEKIESEESEASMSCKEDEINGVCMMHGVGASASLSDKLKAIDKEYHSLKQAGNTAKADYVQGLYAYKAKQATQDGKAAAMASDETSPLGQAVLKYKDALSLEPNNADYMFHYGRMLLTLGQVSEAKDVFQSTLAQRPSHVLSKTYLGICLVGDESRKNEAIHLLMTGIIYKIGLSGQKTERKTLFADDLWNPANYVTAKMFSSLAYFGKNWPSDAELKYDDCVMFGLSCLLNSLQNVFNKSASMDQICWQILRMHYQKLLCTSNQTEASFLTKGFGNLISACDLKASSDLAEMQKSIAEKAVFTNPNNSFSLYLLGEAQFAIYDLISQNQQDLDNAIQILETSLALEGKEAKGPPPEAIRSQKWFQDLHEKESKKFETNAAPLKANPAPQSSASAAPMKGAPTGRGVAAPAARGRGGNAPHRGALATRGAPAARGAPSGRGQSVKPAPASRGAPAARGVAGKAPTKPFGASSAAPQAAKQPEAPNGAAKEQKPQTEKPVVLEAPVIINPKLAQSRMTLARCHSKKLDLEKAKKFYMETISISPHFHDAYIEAGELLTKSDPKGAIDIYTKYPFAPVEEENYNDAYLHGEIVRLIMKEQSYDDPRLANHLIALGKILGKAVIENHIEALDNKGKYKTLMEVFAGVNSKSVDDPDMVQFFKLKCWL